MVMTTEQKKVAKQKSSAKWYAKNCVRERQKARERKSLKRTQDARKRVKHVLMCGKSQSTSTSYDRAASDPVDTSRLFQPTSAEHPDDLFTPVRATPPQTIEPLPDIFPQLLHPPTPVNGSQPTIGPSPTSSTQTIEGTDSVTARIADVRHQLLQWNAQWGPIRHWPRLFEDAFGDAKEQGRSGPWVEEIQSVVEDGRKLVRQLEQVIDGSLPADSWMIRDSWRSSLSLMAHLLEGITVLETRLEIVAPFPHEAIWRHAHNHRETT